MKNIVISPYHITFEHLAASIAKVDRRALFDFIAWSLRDAWRIRNSLPHFRLQSDSHRRYTDTYSGFSSLYCLGNLKSTYYCNIPCKPYCIMVVNYFSGKHMQQCIISNVMSKHLFFLVIFHTLSCAFSPLPSVNPSNLSLSLSLPPCLYFCLSLSVCSLSLSLSVKHLHNVCMFVFRLLWTCPKWCPCPCVFACVCVVRQPSVRDSVDSLWLKPAVTEL